MGSIHYSQWKFIRKFIGEKGERIRLRLINVSNGRVYKPDFGSLQPEVIAIDGMRVARPFDYSGFELAPGNRLDLDIKINTNKYQVAVVDNFTRFSNNLAIIDISNETVETPDFVIEDNYIPDWTNAYSLDPDVVLNLNARRGGKYGIEWTINDKTLDQVEAIELNFEEFQKIKFVNKSSRIHPMHMHGQFFKVLSFNGVQPKNNYWQDTVYIGPKQVVEVGLVPLDKGSWVEHCHILEHAESGMTTIFEVK